MFLYFNKEGKLTTAIPHGEVPRQGNYLNIYVLLDLDFFDDKGEDYLDWALNVELAFPDGKLTIPFTQKEGPEQLEFRKVSDSEVTFDLVDGQEYLTYYFRFSPNQATANAGKIDALVSMQKTVNDLTNRGTGINIGLEDYVYLGKAEINIEKTFGYAKRIINESGSHFKNLMTTIANVDARKMNREDVLKAIEDGSIDEEEALRLIEEYSVDVETLDIGTSEKYDANREDQIPTSKAVESRLLSDRLQAGQSIKIDYDKKIIDVVADAEINSNSKNPIQNKTVKKEFDNLKENYMQLNGEKPMTGDLKMEDKHIIFNKEEDNMKIGYDENDAKMSIDMQNSDYYKAQYHASGFRVGNNAIEANLDVEESKFEFSLGNNISKITPDGFSASKEGTSTSYDDGRITRYIDNYSKYVEIKLPNKSGTLVIDKDVYNKEEIQKLLSAISSLKMEIVEELPTTNISTTTIYLKLRQDGEENNIYEEYVYINNKWETIGTTAVNLSNYALKTDIPTKTSQLTNDSNFATTNQLFSKNYNDLTNKPSIPTSTSQLTNNSGFITNAVNNLTNYYLKSDTYTKDEVQQLLSSISSLKLEVVTNLPTTNISSNTIYLKSLDSTKENNIYEEYIYINGKWETIGTTAVDLTNYALKEDIPTKISELEQDVELGVSEEDVMDIIENNAESTTTLDVEEATEIAIGTSETFDATSDEQIPTSKAVGDNFQPKLTAGENITIDENNVISAADTVIDLGYMDLNSTELSTVITPGLYKFNFNSGGGLYMCLLQVGTSYSLPTQTIVVYNMQILDSEGLAKDTHRLETYYRTAITSNGSTWNAWEHNVYITKDDINSEYITYTHTGPGYSDAVHLINAFVHNRSNIGTIRLKNATPLYFKCNGYASQEWTIISNYFNNSNATIGFTAIRNDIVQGNLTVIKAIDVPINTTITLDTITEDMYKIYTYTPLTENVITEDRVNELIAAYMSANYENGNEGSY